MSNTVFVFGLICRYGKWTHGTFEKLGIPGPKPVMYFGTLSQFSKVCTIFQLLYTVIVVVVLFFFILFCYYN